MNRLSPVLDLNGVTLPVQNTNAVANVVFWQRGQNTVAAPLIPVGASMFWRITPQSLHLSETPVLMPTAEYFQIVCFSLTVVILSPCRQTPNPAVHTDSPIRPASR